MEKMMTNEELFDAYRQVVSERDQLRQVGDDLWNDLMARGASSDYALISTDLARWEALRGIGNEPPIEDWAEC